MRDIKFRGFSFNGNKWIYSSGIDIENGVVSLIVSYGVCFEPEDVEEESVGQYTGLKDRNGKEIYEGDIVKTTGVIESIGKVVFKDCEFCIEVEGWCSKRPHYQSLKLKEKCDDVKSSFYFDKHFEVIGNIYENKDLLEVKNG